jgi:hypothetical protein
MLTGFTPPEDTGVSASTDTPPAVMRRDRDLVTARRDRQRVPAVRRSLNRTLERQAGAPRGER